MALLEGRRSAASKFADADRLILDQAAAEQASPSEVATHTARRLAAGAAGGRLGDLGCGAGADTLALAAVAHVVAVDLDPARLAMAAANAEVRGVGSRVALVQSDVRSWLPPDDVVAVWLDPSRRGPGGRRLAPQMWSPPLDDAVAIARRFPAAGIKVAPGIDLAAVPGDAEVEFISLRGQLIEAVLWLGAAATPGGARATVLPAGVARARDRRHGDLEADVRPAGRYLYDPDPAVGRAGVVRAVGAELEAWQLAEEVAYLTSDSPVKTPFARRFRIIEVRAYSERGARELVESARTGRVEVARRGAPIDTNVLERRLNARLPGGDPVHTLVLTRIAGRITMLLCERERD